VKAVKYPQVVCSDNIIEREKVSRLNVYNPNTDLIPENLEIKPTFISL
jgi:hypothetical protein